MKKRREPDIFTKFTSKVSSWLGRAWFFIIMLLLVVMWLISGPLFGFSDTWQLVINTTTTIITFLTVFIIQNTQNRDSLAINIKLDAIMNELDISREDLVEAEEQGDKKLEDKKKPYREKQKIKRRKQKSNFSYILFHLHKLY